MSTVLKLEDLAVVFVEYGSIEAEGFLFDEYVEIHGRTFHRPTSENTTACMTAIGRDRDALVIDRVKAGTMLQPCKRCWPYEPVTK